VDTQAAIRQPITASVQTDRIQKSSLQPLNGHAMTVVTRFAPSPTGFLHIGGARTALFNWLFARHSEGKFFLRIEDTDRKRSTVAAVDAIFDGLTWLGLDWDGDAVLQFSGADRHVEIARQLLETGRAYFCYTTPDELTAMREKARAEGRSRFYDGRWRDRDPGEAPAGVDPVIRFKAPQSGHTTVPDLVQGDVTVANEQLDDMILVRADGTPTYMLSVVVDDHDMEVTHIIRGDDHLNNAARQVNLFTALDWKAPFFAHIPLIHGPDGAKLSKRHGSLGIEAYRDAGFLPEAVRNYLLRLGWSHGDDEIISTAQAIAWFDIDGIGKSAARFDLARLESLNGHYIKTANETALLEALAPLIETHLGQPASADQLSRMKALFPLLRERSKTLLELIDNSIPFLSDGPPDLDPKAKKLLTDDARESLRRLNAELTHVSPWDSANLEDLIRRFADAEQVKLKEIAQPLRAALTGRIASPPIFDVMVVLGAHECVSRIEKNTDLQATTKA